MIAVLIQKKEKKKKKRKRKCAHKQKTRKLTSNVTEDSPSFLMNVVFDFGTDA